jgi:hypothetical protein
MNVTSPVSTLLQGHVVISGGRGAPFDQDTNRSLNEEGGEYDDAKPWMWIRAWLTGICAVPYFSHDSAQESCPLFSPRRRLSSSECDNTKRDGHYIDNSMESSPA